VPDNRWIEFTLEGTNSNRSAIGAEITLYWDGKEQLQQVSGGDGFASQNDRRVHFGLGKNPKIDKAVIRWPSGSVQTLDDLTPGRLYTVKEPS
jgi:enediyne biosynthesis protein E4